MIKVKLSEMFQQIPPQQKTFRKFGKKKNLFVTIFICFFEMMDMPPPCIRFDHFSGIYLNTLFKIK